MGKLIFCTNGINSMGASSGTLFLGNEISELINKPVLAVDMCWNDPQLLKIMSDQERAERNIDIIMSYALSDKNLDIVIKANREQLNNSKLEVIMGTGLKREPNPEQYENFFKQVKELYPVTIIDAEINKVEEVFQYYADYIVVYVGPNKYGLKSFGDRYSKLINNDNCMIIINKYEKGVMSLSKISNVLEKKSIKKIRYDRNIIKALNENNLNISEFKAAEDYRNIASTILNDLGINIKHKSSFFNVLNMFKSKKEVEDVKLTEQVKDIHRQVS